MSYDETTLHPMCRVPIQTLLDWESTETESVTDYDRSYTARTCVDKPYCFSSRNLESVQEQRERMRNTIDTLKQAGSTIIVVTHGGPATHLFESLTGNDWKVHGESSYCCMSVYSCHEGNWKSLVVNESSFLDETITRTDNYVDD
jgi:broad specificity phosphatase PhoE